jgi:hypothetical protein
MRAEGRRDDGRELMNGKVDERKEGRKRRITNDGGSREKEGKRDEGREGERNGRGREREGE